MPPGPHGDLAVDKHDAWACNPSSPVSAQCSNMNSFFAIVGQPFNQGWGLLKASTWAIAYGLGVQGLLTLIRQAP